MAIPSGLSAQAGFKSESSWGTAVTVDTFVPIISESMSQDIARVESQGIRAGRRAKHTWRPGAITCGGSLSLELATAPAATLLRHMFGAAAAPSGDGPYTHTFTPGDLTGQSLTLQIGVPDVGGTVRTKTYAGSKIPSWEIGCSAGEIATLNLDISAKSEVTNVAVASASYLAGVPFVFTEGALSLAGSPVATVRSMTLAAQNGLQTDRHPIGSATVLQQLEAGQRDYTGNISADFENLDHYARFVAGTEHALVMSFTSGAASLTITTNVRLDGTTPQVAGMDIIEQPLPFVCTSITSDAAAITAVLVNAESVST